jgi:hypothetical protein
MNTKAIIGVSILAVALIVLSCQSSVVGYKVVKDSQENLIKESVNKIDKVKANLLTLKSLFSTGKSLSLSGIIYFIIAFIHFIFSITGITITWFVELAPKLERQPIIWILLTLLFSLVTTSVISALWPLSDLLAVILIIWIAMNGGFIPPQSLYNSLGHPATEPYDIPTMSVGEI